MLTLYPKQLATGCRDKNVVVDVGDVMTRYEWNEECSEQPMRAKNQQQTQQ